MNQINPKKIMHRMRFLFLLILLFTAAVLNMHVYADEEEETEEETIEITVVEEIAAEEIEEAEIPLAGFPDQGRGETRHLVLAGMMFDFSGAYAVYCLEREKQIDALRMKAVEAEEEFRNRESGEKT